MSRTFDADKLQEFLGHVVNDLGAGLHAALAVIGEKLGLYRAMADGDPVTPAELARKTGTNERYVREWLAGQAAGGYVSYDAASARYYMNPEQAFTLADEEGLDVVAGFNLVLSALRDEPKIADAFQTGRGFGWHEHDPGLFLGTERFFKPTYTMNLTQSWIPAIDGLQAKLDGGAKVADVGCGHGASTILMAQSYPRSSFTGFDYHDRSIEVARMRAEKAGMNGNLRFEKASAKEFPGQDYDLIAVFDCLHDMGDPVGAARHVRQALAQDGSWMIVEPRAGDRLEENLNPVGRVFYNASAMICTPASLSQEVGLALGAQAGEARLREVVTEAGFRSFQRVAETPFNLVFEAKS